MTVAGASPDGPERGRSRGGDQGHILAVLRERTRAEHQAIELTLGLMGETLSGQRYRRTLERFYGFWRPLEARLREIPGLDALGLDLAERAKTPLLAEDLVALGVAVPTGARLCGDLPPIGGAAAALGCLYVIEGASLGGQVISKHLRSRLDITSETGGRFFHGYGERTGAMWRAFGASVSALAVTAEAQAEMVDAAIATFRLLRLWCEREEPISTASATVEHDLPPPARSPLLS